MVKGMWSYFRKGRKNANKVFRYNFGMYLKYFIYVIASQLARFSIILAPAADLSRIDLFDNLTEENDFKVNKVFTKLDDSSSVWSVLILNAIKMLSLAAGALVIGYLTKGLFLLGMQLDELNSLDFYLTTIFFMIACGLLGLYFIIKVYFYFDVAIYISSSKKMTVTESLTYTSKVLTKKNVATTVGIIFMNLLEIAFWVGVGVLVYFYVEGNFEVVVTVITSLITAFLLLLFITKKYMAVSIAKLSYYKDVFNDEKNQAVLNQNEFEQSEYLASLFEEQSEVL